MTILCLDHEFCFCQHNGRDYNIIITYNPHFRQFTLVYKKIIVTWKYDENIDDQLKKIFSEEEFERAKMFILHETKPKSKL